MSAHSILDISLILQGTTKCYSYMMMKTMVMMTIYSVQFTYTVAAKNNGAL